VAEPFRISVGDERLALAVARELDGLANVQIHRNSHAWEVSIDGVQTNGFVNSALDSVRRALSGQPSGLAEVLLAGHTYQLHGD